MREMRLIGPVRLAGRLALALVAAAIISAMVGACARARVVKPEPAVAVQQPAMPGQPAKVLDAKALIQERCTKCHGTLRIKMARLLPIPAEPLVDKMIKKGAKLNAEERKVVIEYLAW